MARQSNNARSLGLPDTLTGHFGNGDGTMNTLFGVWFTPLGGVTDQTSAAFYGVGPQHQDLAIHQDALILNYMGVSTRPAVRDCRGPDPPTSHASIPTQVNHYGLPGYALPMGYKRLYGPWLTFFTASSDVANPDAMIDAATATAKANIAASIPYLSVIDDPLYPKARTTVTGTVKVADGRPADSVWVLLSTERAAVEYTVHEPTWFVKADAGGAFSLPGIPPGNYSLYVSSTKNSITGQFRRDNVIVPATSGTLALGVCAAVCQAGGWSVGE